MMENLKHLLNDYSSPAGMDAATVVLSLLLAFVLGQVLAWIYSFTHHGLSYSKSFVQSLIVITMVVALVMTTIAGSFVVAVGLMGALSIIRFRNMIKDTRDIAFLFCALVVGMACGSGRYAIAVIGTAVLGLVLLYLYWADFGAFHSSNALLRFTFHGELNADHPLFKVLRRFCRTIVLTSSQSRGPDRSRMDYAYQITLRKASLNQQMLSELRKIEGIENLSLAIQEQILEL
ncbi:MAG TPA: DUF4956 domain-containing protein [Anaerohalosphaeraceae bacterium]|nr:DUF4956 domain-containing protein [Anaerohalosphaeraceae bacterium]HOL88291.1 DUF4956 domain-containing protein [Anaerohalosphaeraceae bacterium]HPP56703.1 DUF4956 domain-containing protein [Anaerohalosphaeraceae bacterium]